MTTPAASVLPASRMVNRPKGLHFEYKSIQIGLSSVITTLADTLLVRHLKSVSESEIGKA